MMGVGRIANNFFFEILLAKKDFKKIKMKITFLNLFDLYV